MLGWGLQGNLPKGGRREVGSLEDRLSVAGDGDTSAGEFGGAAVVAEDVYGKEGTRVELREDMGLTGGGWYAGQAQFARVGAGDGTDIEQGYGDGIDIRAPVGDGYLH